MLLKIILPLKSLTSSWLAYLPSCKIANFLHDPKNNPNRKATQEINQKLIAEPIHFQPFTRFQKQGLQTNATKNIILKIFDQLLVSNLRSCKIVNFSMTPETIPMRRPHKELIGNSSLNLFILGHSSDFGNGGHGQMLQNFQSLFHKLF